VANFAASRGDGIVTISTDTGSRRRFQPDSRRPGTFFSQTGDHGVLVSEAAPTH